MPTELQKAMAVVLAHATRTERESLRKMLDTLDAVDAAYKCATDFTTMVKGFCPTGEGGGIDNSCGGRGGVAQELTDFAASHGGQIVNNMLVISPAKLLSGNKPGEVGPDSMKVREMDRGKVTIRRMRGKFALEDKEGVYTRLDPDEDLTITHLKW